jgi:hypothetical protein
MLILVPLTPGGGRSWLPDRCACSQRADLPGPAPSEAAGLPGGPLHQALARGAQAGRQYS